MAGPLWSRLNSMENMMAKNDNTVKKYVLTTSNHSADGRKFNRGDVIELTDKQAKTVFKNLVVPFTEEAELKHKIEADKEVNPQDYPNENKNSESPKGPKETETEETSGDTNSSTEEDSDNDGEENGEDQAQEPVKKGSRWYIPGVETGFTSKKKAEEALEDQKAFT